MKSITKYVVVLPLMVVPCAAQQWEIGGALGYGIYTHQTVERSNAQAKAGFRHGLAFGIVGGQDLYRYVGGELRYTYRDSDPKLSSNGTDVRFAGEAHAIHYDFLINAAPKGSRIRPFLATGLGIKVFRGTGLETAFQPLNNLAVYTRVREVKPLISLGAGIRIAVSRHLTMRLDVRDYITPFPAQVIAPVPGARLTGWLHDFVPMVGVGVVF